MNSYDALMARIIELRREINSACDAGAITKIQAMTLSVEAWRQFCTEKKKRVSEFLSEEQ